jgi:hypothetical protein
MKRPRIRFQIAVLGFILMPAAAGVLAVHASATCERFVRTYVTKPVRNTVSKQTAQAWALWRIGHPNWKPNPKLQRPRYIMTRDEVVEKVAFACSVPMIDAETRSIVGPSAPPPVVFLPSVANPGIEFPELAPPEVAATTPLADLPPVSPPGLPLFVGEVPEPASLLMVGGGFLVLGLLLAARARDTPPLPELF